MALDNEITEWQRAGGGWDCGRMAALIEALIAARQQAAVRPASSVAPTATAGADDEHCEVDPDDPHFTRHRPHPRFTYRCCCGGRWEVSPAEAVQQLEAAVLSVGPPQEHYEQLKAAVDSAHRLMAGCIDKVLPVEAWQQWTRTHRDALCDPLSTLPAPGAQGPEKTEED